MTAVQTRVLGRWQRVWNSRRILRLLVARDLKLRYAGSSLGYLWSVLEPLLMSLVYWFVFTQIFPRFKGYDPYIVFLLCAQLPWFWFNGAVSESARALKSEGALVRSTNLPREIWVLRVVLSKGLEYIFALPVLALFVVAYLAPVNRNILLMPLAVLLEIMLLIGIGLLLAPLIVLFKDLDRIIRVGLRIAFYASPVLYPLKNVEAIPAPFSHLYGYNPLVGIFLLYRSAFFADELHWHYVVSSVVGCTIVLVIGVAVFGRLESAVLKEI